MTDNHSSNDKVQSSMNRKISEMSQDEIRSFIRPLGVPGLPYPMALLEKNDQGVSDHRVGVVSSAQNPFLLYSEQSAQRVNGKLQRDMPTPSMMFLLRDLISRMAPTSESCLMTVFGDASAGKTYMFYQIGELVHKQGAIKVDCGGMNMRELFFRTVIDYGQGIKEQLDKRATDGKLQASSLEALEDAFPGAVISKAGKTLIDWSAIGRRKTDAAGVCTEGYEEATSRARSVLELIYTKEGISVQTNSFGIKTVPGEVFEAWESGRPLVLDEFNKSKRGTLDTFQTFLQFLNGEKGFDTLTIYNPMAQSSEEGDSPKSITLNRKDRKLGWFTGIAGNDSSDGESTQELSVSMMTRLNPTRVGAPALRDWEHRLSQIYTGLPLTTLYNLYYDDATDKERFGQWLIDLRRLGLSADEIQAIPAHEMHMLENYSNTFSAIKQLAAYYDKRAQLANPESEFARDTTMNDLADELSAHGDRVHVSFRKAIADFNKSLLATPKVLDAKAAKLSFDLETIFNEFSTESISETEPGWHRLGENVSRTIQEDIANDTIGMERTHAALLRICEDNGVINALRSGGKASKQFKTLSELLKYDNMSDLGGVQELKAIRTLLIANLKSKYGTKISGKEESIIPLPSLGDTVRYLRDNNSGNFVIPNNDVSSVVQSPLQEAATITKYPLAEGEEGEEDPVETGDYALSDYRAVLAGLAMPLFADQNKSKLWLDDLEVQDSEDTVEGAEPVDSYINVINGNSKLGFNIALLEVADENGNPAYLRVLEDRRSEISEGAEGKMLVVGNDNIPPILQVELANAGITYLTAEDENFTTKTNAFLQDGASFRATHEKLTEKEEVEAMSQNLIIAFNAICSLDEGSDKVIPEKTTICNMFQNFAQTSKPIYYKRICQKKAGANNGSFNF